MKLYYFDGKGRAETSRLVMRLGGTDFEDIRFTGPEFATKYKEMSPSGQVPFLELDDGSILTQSSAIEMYCAMKSGMLPEDPFQRARTVELTNAFADVMQPLGPTFAIKDLDEKIAARKALIAEDGALNKKMKSVESMVAKVTTPFYCGDSITLADCHLYVFVSMMRSGMMDGISAEYADSFEKIAALRSKIADSPKVKELYKEDKGFEP